MTQRRDMVRPKEMIVAKNMQMGHFIRSRKLRGALSSGVVKQCAYLLCNE